MKSDSDSRKLQIKKNRLLVFWKEISFSDQNQTFMI